MPIRTWAKSCTHHRLPVTNPQSPCVAAIHSSSISHASSFSPLQSAWLRTSEWMPCQHRSPMSDGFASSAFGGERPSRGGRLHARVDLSGTPHRHAQVLTHLRYDQIPARSHHDHPSLGPVPTSFRFCSRARHFHLFASTAR
jgi:hypothetical protein